LVEEAPVDAVAEPVEEPAGWAAAPETDEPEAAADVAAAEVAADPGADPTPTDAAAVATAAPAAAEPEPAVPAGWYADPSGRYELRYWDGSAWTEHVSRAGQQFTDPPVA
jgi:hypothetical protein